MRISSLKDLNKEFARYFGNLYQAKDGVDINNQLGVVQIYPKIFNEEDNDIIGQPISFDKMVIYFKVFHRGQKS